MCPSAISTISTMRHWPDIWRDFEKEPVNAAESDEKHRGEHIHGPSIPPFNNH